MIRPGPLGAFDPTPAIDSGISDDVAGLRDRQHPVQMAAAAFDLEVVDVPPLGFRIAIARFECSGNSRRSDCAGTRRTFARTSRSPSSSVPLCPVTKS